MALNATRKRSLPSTKRFVTRGLCHLKVGRDLAQRGGDLAAQRPKATMQTTAISARIRAYSAIPWPSSRCSKLLNRIYMLNILLTSSYYRFDPLQPDFASSRLVPLVRCSEDSACQIVAAICSLT